MKQPRLVQLITLAGFVLPMLGGRLAHAEPSRMDRTLAQSLFEQGKALMGAGNYAEGCKKLEESQGLDPSGGTMLNLALCHENAGKVSTASADFKEALSFARRDGRPEREQAALEHIAALEPKLPHLTLVVAGPTGDEVVSIDGEAIARVGWGAPISVDPGPHEIVASAQGKQKWASTVPVALSENKQVAIPELVSPSQAAPVANAFPPGPSPTPAPPPEQPPDSAQGAPPSSDGSSKKTAGWIVGGAGVIAIGVGAFFGVQAVSRRHDSNDECPSGHCTERGVSLNDDAKTAAWIADFGVGLGLVGVGVGAYLLLSGGTSSERIAQHRNRTRAVSVDARPLPAGGALSVGGVW